MSEEWSKFVESATVSKLKSALRILKCQSTGTKAELKVRLQDAVQGFTTENFLSLLQEVPSTSKDLSVDDSFPRGDPEPTDDSSSEDEEELDAEITKLRRLCKKKEEIKRLRLQLRELELDEVDSNMRSNSSCGFKDIEESLSSFSGDDNFPIQRWLEQFEESAEVLGLSDRNKFIYGKRLLQGTAKLFVRTVKIRSWSELKEALKNEFHKAVTKSDIYNELRGRKKLRDETMQQYVLHMQEIASHTNVEEEDIIQFIIKGIPDSEVNKTILYSANNLDELKALLRKYAKFKSNHRDNNFNRASVHVSQPNRFFPLSKPKTTQQTDSKPVKNQPPKSSVICFKCGQSGHIATKCGAENTVLMLQQHSRTKRKINLPDHPPSEVRNGENDFERNVLYRWKSNDLEMSINLLTLLDSGSPISFIQERFLPSALLSTVKKSQQTYCGVNASPLEVIGSIVTNVESESSVTFLNIFVVKNFSMTYPIVLGRDYIGKIGLTLRKANLASDNQDPQITCNSKDHHASVMHTSHTAEIEETQQILNIEVIDEGDFSDRVKEFLAEKFTKERASLNEVRESAVKCIESTQRSNKIYYDNRHKNPTKYRLGQYVMVKNTSTVPGVNRKLLAKYRGPYEVKKILPNDRYLISDIEGLQLTRLPYKGIVSPGNMRPYNVNIAHPENADDVGVAEEDLEDSGTCGED